MSINNQPSVNMVRLNPSKRKLVNGDIFVFKMSEHPYIFGRVIRTDALWAHYAHAYLIYVYNSFSDSKHDIPPLLPTNLLLPPILINRLGWSRSYFETIAHRPLTADDVLPQHCFKTLRGC
jgi:hypothetical protein